MQQLDINKNLPSDLKTVRVTMGAWHLLKIEAAHKQLRVTDALNELIISTLGKKKEKEKTPRTLLKKRML